MSSLYEKLIAEREELRSDEEEVKKAKAYLLSEEGKRKLEELLAWQEESGVTFVQVDPITGTPDISPFMENVKEISDLVEEGLSLGEASKIVREKKKPKSRKERQ